MRRHRGGIGNDELSFFNRQLASMARLDLSFPAGLRALAAEVDGREFQGMVRDVLADLEEGRRLSDALARRGDVFSELYLGIVRAGEESGDLASALDGLANYSESMLFLRQRVRAAMAYPTVALAVSLALLAFVFGNLVPNFRTIYSSLGMELPGITEFYIDVASVLKEHSDLILLGVAGLVIAVLLAKRIGAGGRGLSRIALNLPFYGKLLRQVLLLRFCETLRALLGSRVSLVPALDLTSRTLGDNVLGLTVSDMSAAAAEGRRMADVLGRNSIFPRTFVWKFALAEEQGTLEPTLDELSRYLDLELKTTTARFSSLLEPFLIGMVGLLVGSLVLSVFLPIFKMHGLF